jgi:hypothetical protein
MKHNFPGGTTPPQNLKKDFIFVLGAGNVVFFSSHYTDFNVVTTILLLLFEGQGTCTISGFVHTQD